MRTNEMKTQAAQPKLAVRLFLWAGDDGAGPHSGRVVWNSGLSWSHSSRACCQAGRKAVREVVSHGVFSTVPRAGVSDPSRGSSHEKRSPLPTRAWKTVPQKRRYSVAEERAPWGQASWNWRVIHRGARSRLQGDLVGAHCLGEVQFLQNGQAGRGAAQIGGFQGIEVFRPSLSQIGGQGGLKSAPPGSWRRDSGRTAFFCEAE